jgi:hypothetical protein
METVAPTVTVEFVKPETSEQRLFNALLENAKYNQRNESLLDLNKTIDDWVFRGHSLFDTEMWCQDYEETIFPLLMSGLENTPFDYCLQFRLHWMLHGRHFPCSCDTDDWKDLDPDDDFLELFDVLFDSAYLHLGSFDDFLKQWPSAESQEVLRDNKGPQYEQELKRIMLRLFPISVFGPRLRDILRERVKAVCVHRTQGKSCYSRIKIPLVCHCKMCFPEGQACCCLSEKDDDDDDVLSF